MTPPRAVKDGCMTPKEIAAYLRNARFPSYLLIADADQLEADILAMLATAPTYPTPGVPTEEEIARNICRSCMSEWLSRWDEVRDEFVPSQQEWQSHGFKTLDEAVEKYWKLYTDHARAIHKLLTEKGRSQMADTDRRDGRDGNASDCKSDHAGSTPAPVSTPPDTGAIRQKLEADAQRSPMDPIRWEWNPADIAALLAEVERKDRMIEAAAGWFDHYAALHQAKNDPLAMEKAKVNRQRANELRACLSPPKAKEGDTP